MPCKINTDLLPIKAHYLSFFAGVGPIVLFMPTYAKQLGFSSVLVGTIYTVLPMVGMLSKPLMGALADRFHCHKCLVITLLAVAASSWFCLQFIPEAEGEIIGDFDCHSESTMSICSPEEKPDKCAIYKLQHEHIKKKIVTCTLICTLDEEFRNEIHNTWNITDYSQIKNDPVAQKGAVSLTEIGTTSTSPAPTKRNETLSKITFNAHLSTDNIREIRRIDKKCLLLQVSEVIGAKPDEHTSNPKCNAQHNSTCQLECDSIFLAKYHGKAHQQNNATNYRFWMFLLLMIAGWIGLASVTNLGDTICFGLIGDSTTAYGNQRLWGSIGWGFTSIFSGLLMDRFSDEKADKNYVPVFYMVAIFLTIDILSTSRVKETKRVHSPSFLRDIGKLFLDMRVMIFIFWCILAGTFNGLIGNFLFWHLEDLADCKEEEWIKTLEGLYIFIQGFGGEIPFFFINGYLLKTIGHIHCMNLVLFAFGLKFLFYSIITNPWYVLPIGLLNGITFSTFYATMASHSAAVAAPGTEATVLGLVSALYEGVGVSLGSFLGGLLLYYMEGKRVFQIYGIVAIGMCALHMTVQHFLNRNDNLDVSATENMKAGKVTKTPSVNPIMLSTNDVKC
ncbi:major facilitator superfamily domain-containing protein 6-like isoform X2 [Lycorma delicatula]|uniref:major facilitator superfamily domain-containing protein 6-like isoform X2 n=1 Tax=Lycorma delicatula TaxID=130591 RepID=UPI003F518EB9